MKYIRPGKEVSIKLTLPSGLPWKVMDSLARDLGFTQLNAPDVFGAIRNRDYNMLRRAVSSFDPQCMVNSIGATKANGYPFYRRYQLSAFLKKFPFAGVDTLTPALDKFFQAEQNCKLFNKENFRALEVLSDKHPTYFGILDDMRHDILELLGDRPDLNCIYGFAMHGPGMSAGDLYKGGEVTSYYKWSSLPYTVTKAALPHAKAVIESDPRWIGALDNWYRSKFCVPVTQPLDVGRFWSSIFKVVDGSRITTVPKTAETDRTIAIEPMLNVFLQLGVDHVLKSRLKRGWGYDLQSQKHNQDLAKEGSIDGTLATVDLSAASDTISLKICEMLLPPLWYDLLLDLRSPVGVVQGKQHLFEKISSMGNGFTFALESIIFGALTRRAIKRTQSVRKSAVYGDDIVLPTTAVSYLYDLLSLCGFGVNISKSFTSGPFRESCGKDYFLGYNVRPVFLKRKLTTVTDLFYLHNVLYEKVSNLPWFWEVDFQQTLRLLKKYIPHDLRRQFSGPPSESLDTHLFSGRTLRRNSHHERIFDTIQSVASKFNRGTDFFFRKLMYQRGESIPLQLWDRRRRLNTGNTFDVTKRGRVRFKCTRVRMP